MVCGSYLFYWLINHRERIRLTAPTALVCLLTKPDCHQTLNSRFDKITLWGLYSPHVATSHSGID